VKPKNAIDIKDSQC